MGFFLCRYWPVVSILLLSVGTLSSIFYFSDICFKLWLVVSTLIYYVKLDFYNADSQYIVVL
jgi:hypothetical protein